MCARLVGLLELSVLAGDSPVGPAATRCCVLTTIDVSFLPQTLLHRNTPITLPRTSRE